MANKRKPSKKSMDVVTPDSKKKKTVKPVDIIEEASEETIVHIEPGRPEPSVTVLTESERYEKELNEAFPEEPDEEPEEPTESEPEPEPEPEPIETPADEIEEIETTMEQTMEHKEEAKPKKAKKSREAEPKPSAGEPKNQPAKKSVKIISTLLVLASAVSVGFLIFNISRSNLLPAKFFYPVVALLALLALIFLRVTIRRKTKLATHVVIDLLAAVGLAASLFGSFKLSDTLDFLDKNLNKDSYQTVTYNVVTGEASKYGQLGDVKNTTIIAPPDFSVEEATLKEAVEKQAEATLAFEASLETVTNLPLEDSDALILLGDSIYASMIENSEDYAKQTKIIGNITVEIKVAKDTSDDSNLTNSPFLIYLSGIDTRSGTMPYTSLSDVNMAIAVNPKTSQVLMVTIPRDYYVQIHGTTGLHDKLTHAGSLGGVQLSMATIEDLLGVKFSEYVRVNFNFVTGLVDAIGGITVYSDVDYSFTTHTDSSCTFNPGNNFVYGRCALAFARERYAYASGDRHRGENQEQVIAKILEKVTSSSTLVSKYTDILNALDGTFETSLTSSDISSLVRYQLDKMPKWKTTTKNLDGPTGGAYTYSYPTQLLSVMFEDEASIAAAKEELAKVLSATE